MPEWVYLTSLRLSSARCCRVWFLPSTSIRIFATRGASWILWSCHPRAHPLPPVWQHERDPTGVRCGRRRSASRHAGAGRIHPSVAAGAGQRGGSERLLLRLRHRRHEPQGRHASCADPAIYSFPHLPCVRAPGTYSSGSSAVRTAASRAELPSSPPLPPPPPPTPPPTPLAAASSAATRRARRPARRPTGARLGWSVGGIVSTIRASMTGQVLHVRPSVCDADGSPLLLSRGPGRTVSDNVAMVSFPFCRSPSTWTDWCSR